MAGEFTAAKKWVEAHPFVTAGGVFVIGAVLIYLYYSGGAAPAQASTGGSADAAYAAELQAQVQQEALQAQYGAQLSSQQTAASVATTQYSDQLSALQSNNATQLSLAQIGATTSQAGITAQQNVELAGIAAQTQIATTGDATTEFALSQETTQAWNNEFAGLYNTYLQAGSPTAVATANLISKITPATTASSPT